MSAVVIGVGNKFRHDDDAGPQVVAALEGLALTDTRLAVCDGEPTRMIELWTGVRLAIVIDAAAADAESGRRVGDVLRWEMRHRPDEPSELADPAPPAHAEAPRTRAGNDRADVALPAGPDAAGTHGLGPGTAVELAAILGRLPERLVVFAVVGADFGPGPGLSPPVAAAVAGLARDVAAELAGQGLSARIGKDFRSWQGLQSGATLKP